MPFHPDEIVKTCSKLETGLRMAPEGMRACCMGAIMAPVFWTAEELNKIPLTKESIADKRRWLLECLNDETSEIDCKKCYWVTERRYGDIDFTRLGHVDFGHYSYCNLRCSYCGFTQANLFVAPQYDALSILQLFSPEDVEWNAYVDLDGGEPSLLPNLQECIDYFRSRRIRILVFTNAVRFHPAIAEGLADGTISWVITSLDAGTPSTFNKIKGRDHYATVVENLTRYAAAGSLGGGMLAVKYIVSDENGGNDDLLGFTYTMLAIRPQKIWLTLDFSPIAGHYMANQGLGLEKYEQHIEAYARLYILLKKHGIEPLHFYKQHLAPTVKFGKELLDKVLSRIEELKLGVSLDDPDLHLPDFRKGSLEKVDASYITFSTDPLVHKLSDGSLEPWSLAGKRVLLAPVCKRTRDLLPKSGIREAEILGFIDRSPVVQEKRVEGFPVFGYDAIPEADFILVAGPEQHHSDIIESLGRLRLPGVQLAALPID